MAGQEIKTGIDALVAYINEHGETNVSVVAEALGVGESAVLEWANVLEKANVIFMVHKSGRLFLAPAGSAPKANKETKQAELSGVQEMISSDIAAVDSISATLDTFTKSMGKVDDLFNTKYRKAKVVLDTLNMIDAKINKMEKNISAKVGYIKTVSDKAKELSESAKKNIDTLASFSLDTNNARAVAQELRDLLKSYEKNTEDLYKGLDVVIYKYRKNALDLSREMKDKHNQLVEVMNFDQSQIREYERLDADYKRERARLAREAQEINSRTLQEIEKGKKELSDMIIASNVQMRSIKDSVGSIKKDLGGVEELNEQLVKIRASLDELTKQRNSLLSELKKMQQEAKTGRNLKKVQSQAKAVSESIAALKEKTNAARLSFGKIGTTDASGK